LATSFGLKRQSGLYLQKNLKMLVHLVENRHFLMGSFLSLTALCLVNVQAGEVFGVFILV
jgi:hypothetical protein